MALTIQQLLLRAGNRATVKKMALTIQQLLLRAGRPLSKDLGKRDFIATTIEKRSQEGHRTQTESQRPTADHATAQLNKGRHLHPRRQPVTPFRQQLAPWQTLHF